MLSEFSDNKSYAYRYIFFCIVIYLQYASFGRFADE